MPARLVLQRLLTAAAAGGLVAAVLAAPPALAQGVRQAGDCVTIGKPRPTAAYTYERTDQRGTVTEYTRHWDELTATSSRQRMLRGRSAITMVTEHRIEDDVSVIDVVTSSDPGGAGNSRTAFQPGAVGDPAFRACAGRSWAIPAVNARHSFAQGEHSAPTYAGTLRIVAIRESVTVPAGTFQAVRYARTMATPVGQSVEEYWKSIEHGVIVKHVSTLPDGGSTEELVSIR
jgi:hypothetical protein